MATLDLLGAAEKAKTFDWSGYSMKKLGKVWLNDEMELEVFSNVAKEAGKRGRTDILKAASKSINYSRRKQKILSLINSNPVSRTCWQEIRKLRNLIRRLRAGTGALARRPKARSAEKTQPAKAIRGTAA